MCKVLKISRSGYYKWGKGVLSNREQRKQVIKKEISIIHKQSKYRYGSPRITKELNMKGIKASQPFVAVLMRDMSIKSIIRKRYKATTDSKHSYAIAENKLKRAFKVEASNKVWVLDITYIHTLEGWLYLTTVIDLFNRKVIGWALSETMKAKETTLAAFNMAKLNSPINSKALIFHSDRGIQYACDEFRTELEKYPFITRSISRKGDCWDNAVAESFFKTLKVELIYQERYHTKQQAALSIFEYIETWYNKNRRHKQLNNLTITEHQKLINNNLKDAA